MSNNNKKNTNNNSSMPTTLLAVERHSQAIARLIASNNQKGVNAKIDSKDQQLHWIRSADVARAEDTCAKERSIFETTRRTLERKR